MPDITIHQSRSHLVKFQVLTENELAESKFDNLKFFYRQAQNRQIDVIPIRSIYCHEGPNANGDYFLPEMLELRYPTLLFKPIRYRHETPVGVISDVFLYKPPADAEDPRVYIEYGGLLWKLYAPDLVQEIMDLYRRGEAFSSMEVWYTRYDIMHGDNRYGMNSPEAEKLRPFVGQIVDGKPVYFVFTEFVFGGAGIVPNPADKDAKVLAIGSRKQADLLQLPQQKIAKTEEVDDGMDGLLLAAINRMKTSTKEQALFGHAILHRWWRNPSATSWTKDEIIEEHTRVVRILVERYGSGCYQRDGLYDSLPESLKKKIEAQKEKKEASDHSELSADYELAESEARDIEIILEAFLGNKGEFKVEDNVLKTELEQIKESVATLTSAKEAAEKERDEARKQVEELTQKLAAEVAEKEALQAELAQVKTVLAQLELERKVDARVAELKQAGIILDDEAWKLVRDLLAQQSDEAYEAYKTSLIKAIASVRPVEQKEDKDNNQVVDVSGSKGSTNIPPVNPVENIPSDEDSKLSKVAAAFVYRTFRGADV